jgi:hypothetical protein
MSNIAIHKIAACKFDYEFLGKDIPSLARDYSFRETDIEEEIQLRGWVRRIEPTELPQTNDLQQFADALESITRSKLSIISLFRQIDHQPLLAQLEKTLLDKALQLATDLNSQDDKASTKLMNIVKAVAQIQDRNPIDLADQVKDQLKNGGSGVTVQIMNHIN